AQNEGALAGRIVSGPAAHVAEACALIEPACRHVALVHLEKDRAGAEPRQPAQVEIEQAPRQAFTAPRGRDCDRQDFSLVQREPRKDEADEAAAKQCAMGDDVAVDEELLKFAVAPSAMKRGAVQRSAGAGIAEAGFGQRGLAALACEQPL